tara:strand:+ start:22047 stop:22796 length:750 start_codon:yes stop_codon:yes gene_type:complete
MINENEITQPELNMVTEESSAPVAEPQAEPTVEPATEVTETSAEPTTETVSETSSTIKEEPETGSYPASVETSESEVQKTLDQTQERLKQVEKQNLQNQLMYETESYKQQLIQQGYTPEQSQAASQQFYNNRMQQATVEQEYKQQIEFKEGQFKASLHYGKKFNIDPEVLLKYQTPQEMEVAAKHMSEVRSLKEENARLKQGKVPTQNFDSNSAPADASSSEERLLDLYNSGVRNPETEAAARRAAGIG